ncbi:hypothetical protein O3G_MSEX011892 [Manduca sexta]|uniref:PHD-type domain-containing protein n=1 Tax=Manduca sexta TaxID=7130 RepID=A0A921ZLS3_MANSE|nr:hypothetical protein O3G_MSEX011892 [Manduca sexta]
MTRMCSGCANEILSSKFMQCSVCSKLFDLECLQIADNNFDNFDRLFKSKWLCPACLSTRPKGDNTFTPVRGTTSSHSNIFISCDNTYASENVTKTRGSRVKSTAISPVHYNYEENNNLTATLLSEITQLKTEINFLKQQNSDITFKITDVSNSLQHILDEHIFQIKEKDRQISSLKDSVAQLQERLQLYECDKLDTEKDLTQNNDIKLGKTMKVKTKPKENIPQPTMHLPAATTIITTPSMCCLNASTDLSVNESRNVGHNATADCTDNQTADWKEVSYKRNRNRSLNLRRGTATPGSTNLEAASRSTYLHLFYVKVGTTEEQVLNHLTTICDTDAYVVQALKARGNYASFKLEVPAELSKQVMSVENWAEGICIKLWKNFRPKKSLKETKK